MKSILRPLLFAFLLFTTANYLFGQWVQSGVDSSYVVSITVSGSNLFAGTDSHGIFLSTDNGTSWAAVNSGLTLSLNSFKSLVVSGTNLFAGSSIGLYRSTNSGTNWTQINSLVGSVPCLAVSGTNLFAGTDVFGGGTAYGGVYRSTNNGTSWTQTNSGLTSTSISSLVISTNGIGGTNLFAGTDSGVFLSTNNGTSWASANTGLTSLRVLCFVVAGANLYVGTDNLNGAPGGVYLSTTNGSTWTKTGLASGSISCLASSGTTIFAAINFVGVYLSTDNGTNWTPVNSGLMDMDGYAASVAVSVPYLFAGNYNGVWRRSLSEMITSAGSSDSKSLPMQFTLDQNFPNPFNPTTTIRFSLARAELVTLNVSNVLGEYMTTLISGPKPPGSYLVNFNGEKYPSGVYFYTLTTQDRSLTKSMILLK
jgi:hypothetical protein